MPTRSDSIHCSNSPPSPKDWTFSNSFASDGIKQLCPNMFMAAKRFQAGIKRSTGHAGGVEQQQKMVCTMYDVDYIYSYSPNLIHNNYHQNYIPICSLLWVRV